MVQFSLTQCDGFVIINFLIIGDVLDPKVLGNLDIPDVPFHQGIVLSGRGPVWLYAYLTHHFHPARWVATFDPRLAGAIVVQSHFPGVCVGQVVPTSV